MELFLGVYIYNFTKSHVNKTILTYFLNKYIRCKQKTQNIRPQNCHLGGASHAYKCFKHLGAAPLEFPLLLFQIMLNGGKMDMDFANILKITQDEVDDQCQEYHFQLEKEGNWFTHKKGFALFSVTYFQYLAIEAVHYSFEKYGLGSQDDYFKY